MKISLFCIALVLSSGFAASAGAQWPPYPTPDVPLTPDGTPDLEGPVPRTAEGHPDFTGIWQNDAPRGRGDGSGPGQHEPQPPPPGTPPRATFFDIGANLKDGLPLRPWAKKLKDARMANNNKDNPDAHCLPLGYMQFHLHPQPRKIVQTPQELIIMYESNYGLRQIFTDGRSLPDNDPQPWWYGYSVGHWEGDTLVVESTHFRDGGWLDVNGSPLTDQATITERFRRPDFGHMQIDVTIDDPKAYTKPFTVRVNHRIMLNTNLIEFICNENEQSSRYYIGEGSSDEQAE
jgi:hypothetical protein